ncbi:hypothetical protein [Desertibaculum subflavum]|uniref:hypothetical protein n=1 Tax=Desertibaculum subflavum TaxID=2268458 RepID=UPI000E664D9A
MISRLALASLLCLAATVPGQAAELLSIRGITRTGEVLSRFRLDIANASVVAVCRIPRGWSIGATDIGNGNSSVSGEAVPGAAPLRAATGPVLEDMFLIDQPEPTAHPARFQGTATVAAQGSTQPPQDRPLDGGNIALSAAERCP